MQICFDTYPVQRSKRLYQRGNINLSAHLFSDNSCKLNSGSLLSISGGRFSFLPAIRKPVWETRWVYILYTKTIFVCPRKLFLRGQLLRFRTLLTKTWSFISFVHELYFIFSGNLKLDFLLFFCFAWYFFISSIATSVMYFSCIIRCALIYSLLVSTFFNNLLTLPHVPTTSKASQFMLASEHLGCISGPWRIVLLFLRDFDKHFCSRSVCDARLHIDQNLTLE